MGAPESWSFPEGAVTPDGSLKGYSVATTDHDAGHVSWCDYAPGESYLVVTRHPHLGGKHRVVPAGMVASVDHEHRVVKLGLSSAELDERAPVEDPSQPLDWDFILRFERGSLEAGGVWTANLDPD